MAVEIPKGPDPAVICRTHHDRLSRADPHAAHGAPASFWPVSAVGIAASCCLPLASHTLAVAEDHSPAQHGQPKGHMHT